MKQTAVDELLSHFNKDGFNKFITNEIDFMANELVIEKERMYSEEDLKKIIYLTWLKCLDANGGDFIDNRNEILEQFKNK